MDPEQALREVDNADKASMASKVIPTGASHVLPRGATLWGLPVELVYVELRPIEARRCYHGPLSVLPWTHCSKAQARRQVLALGKPL